MLHELLLSLLGYTGDLIVDEREHQKSLGVHLSPDAPISDERCFKLAPDISFIEPSDRDLIERIITLGFYYRELDRFSTSSRNLSWIRSANVSPLARVSELSKGKAEKPSVYRRAIANGRRRSRWICCQSVFICALLNKFFLLVKPSGFFGIQALPLGFRMLNISRSYQKAPRGSKVLQDAFLSRRSRLWIQNLWGKNYFLNLKLTKLKLCYKTLRNHPSFIKDLLNMPLTLFGLLQPVIFGSLWLYELT